MLESKEVLRDCRVVSDGHRCWLEGAPSGQIWVSIRKNDDSTGLQHMNKKKKSMNLCGRERGERKRKEGEKEEEPDMLQKDAS